MEALFSHIIIDAHKGRDVAIFDVPGEYLNDDITGENNHIKIEGEFADILCKVNSEHKTFTYLKWSKGAITNSDESTIRMHRVHTNIALPVQKNFEMPWIHYQ